MCPRTQCRQNTFCKQVKRASMCVVANQPACRLRLRLHCLVTPNTKKGTKSKYLKYRQQNDTSPVMLVNTPQLMSSRITNAFNANAGGLSSPIGIPKIQIHRDDITCVLFSSLHRKVTLLKNWRKNNLTCP